MQTSGLFASETEGSKDFEKFIFHASPRFQFLLSLKSYYVLRSCFIDNLSVCFLTASAYDKSELRLRCLGRCRAVCDNC